MTLELDVSTWSVGVGRSSSWRSGILWSIACSPIIPVSFGDMHPVEGTSSRSPMLSEGDVGILDELEELGEGKHESFIRSVPVSVHLWKGQVTDLIITQGLKVFWPSN